MPWKIPMQAQIRWCWALAGASAQLIKNLLPVSEHQHPKMLICYYGWDTVMAAAGLSTLSPPSGSLCVLSSPKAKVYSRKVQLQLNIHERRQVAPCPIAFTIKSSCLKPLFWKRGTAWSWKGKYFKERCQSSTMRYGTETWEVLCLLLLKKKPRHKLINCRSQQRFQPCIFISETQLQWNERSFPMSQPSHPSALLISCAWFETVASIVTSWGHRSASMNADSAEQVVWWDDFLISRPK